ncbi:MAG: dipeptidase [Thermoguttaceae bacterium]|jgi:acetylornithine deacetylase/succinyl-diaminopimelate desuccinylase-like protein
MKDLKKYIRENQQRFLEKWFEALRIPSVSALPAHKPDMRRMAEWLTDVLGEELGFDARLIETETNPLVFARSPEVPDTPTVLIYGHYDVQPVDPLDEWRTPPFEPTLIDDKVFCRGADDDKGQSLTHIFALMSILAVKGRLPLNVKFIYEGEEEVGSNALSTFLQAEENRRLLCADVILVSDTDKPGPDQPGITYGLRGVVGYELTLTGPNRDLHSGLYGGSVRNPAQALCAMLDAVIDRDGKIQIPGFYDAVVPISESERAELAKRPFDEAEALKAIGLDAWFGEPEYTVPERRGARPSFDINGLTSGYQGEGGKTIIPAKASAKFTFRLVPNQEPESLTRSLEKFFRDRLPAGIKMELVFQHGAGGMVIPLESRFLRAAARGLSRAFGKEPLFIRDGGSIPIIAEIKNRLGADLILAGFGLEEDGIHAPNEYFALRDFLLGIEASAAILTELGNVGQTPET